MGPELTWTKETQTSWPLHPILSSICSTMSLLPPFQQSHPSLSIRPRFLLAPRQRHSLKGPDSLRFPFVLQCFQPHLASAFKILETISELRRLVTGRVRNSGMVCLSEVLPIRNWKKGHRFLGSFQDLLNPFWGIIRKICELSKHNRRCSYVGWFRNVAQPSSQDANQRVWESKNGSTTLNICRELGKSFHFPMFSHSKMKALTAYSHRYCEAKIWQNTYKGGQHVLAPAASLFVPNSCFSEYWRKEWMVLSFPLTT